MIQNNQCSFITSQLIFTICPIVQDGNLRQMREHFNSKFHSCDSALRSRLWHKDRAFSIRDTRVRGKCNIVYYMEESVLLGTEPLGTRVAYFPYVTFVSVVSFKVPMKWNFCPLFYSRKLKSMLHWFIIFEFKLSSGAQNNFSIPPKLAKIAIFVFRGL